MWRNATFVDLMNKIVKVSVELEKAYKKDIIATWSVDIQRVVMDLHQLMIMTAQCQYQRIRVAEMMINHDVNFAPVKCHSSNCDGSEILFNFHSFFSSCTQLPWKRY